MFENKNKQTYLFTLLAVAVGFLSGVTAEPPCVTALFPLFESELDLIHLFLLFYTLFLLQQSHHVISTRANLSSLSSPMVSAAKC